MWGFIFHVSNTALNVLFEFLYNFMKLLVHKVKKDEVNENKSLQQLPQSFKMGLSGLGLKVDEYIVYTVCTKCDSLYELTASSEKDSFGHLVTKHCAHVGFPNHPMCTKQKQCGAPLLHKICRSNTNHVTFQPFKIYVYHPISIALSHLSNCTGFSTTCEHWRQHHEDTEYMTDIYDGQLWKGWQVRNECDFLISFPTLFGYHYKS